MGRPKKDKPEKPKPPKVVKQTARDVIQPRKGKPRKAKANAVGRPTKFTPELGDTICEALRLGVPYYVAAGYARIALQTLHNWINEGFEGKNEELAEFAWNVEEARNGFVIDTISGIKQAARNKDGSINWLPLAWMAERSRQDIYAIVKTKVEVEDTTIRDIALKNNEEAARKSLAERFADCPVHHEIIDVQPASDLTKDEEVGE